MLRFQWIQKHNVSIEKFSQIFHIFSPSSDILIFLNNNIWALAGLTDTEFHIKLQNVIYK